MFRHTNDREDHASFHDDRDLAAFLDAMPGDRAANDEGNVRQRCGYTARWSVGVLGLLGALLGVIFGVLLVYRFAARCEGASNLALSGMSQYAALIVPRRLL